MRNTLTRRSFLSNIERQTGAVIILRGYYFPPGARMQPGQAPLHIHVSSGPIHGQVWPQTNCPAQHRHFTLLRLGFCAAENNCTITCMHCPMRQDGSKGLPKGSSGAVLVQHAVHAAGQLWQRHGCCVLQREVRAQWYCRLHVAQWGPVRIVGKQLIG